MFPVVKTCFTLKMYFVENQLYW